MMSTCLEYHWVHDSGERGVGKEVWEAGYKLDQSSERGGGAGRSRAEKPVMSNGGGYPAWELEANKEDLALGGRYILFFSFFFVFFFVFFVGLRMCGVTRGRNMNQAMRRKLFFQTKTC